MRTKRGIRATTAAALLTAALAAAPAPAAADDGIELRRDGSKAVQVVTVPRQVTQAEGFDWGDAAIGAGAGLAALLFATAGAHWLAAVTRAAGPPCPPPGVERRSSAMRTRVVTPGVITLALLSLAPAAHAQHAQMFSAPTDFPAGDGPSSVAIGHFNADTDPDLAVSNYVSGKVSVLLGLAGGDFAFPTSFDAGIEPVSVAVGSLNGDAHPDLAVANFVSGDVSVLLGGPGGGFGAPTEYGDLDAPRSVAMGDFDGDTDIDLAVADNGFGGFSGSLWVLLGDGAGGFGAGTSFAAGDKPESVAVGDFDGDADLDLVVANRESDDVSVFLGDGAGSFGPGDEPPGRGRARLGCGGRLQRRHGRRPCRSQRAVRQHLGAAR